MLKIRIIDSNPGRSKQILKNCIDFAGGSEQHILIKDGRDWEFFEDDEMEVYLIHINDMVDRRNYPTASYLNYINIKFNAPIILYSGGTINVTKFNKEFIEFIQGAADRKWTVVPTNFRNFGIVTGPIEEDSVYKLQLPSALKLYAETKNCRQFINKVIGLDPVIEGKMAFLHQLLIPSVARLAQLEKLPEFKEFIQVLINSNKEGGIWADLNKKARSTDKSAYRKSLAEAAELLM